MGGAVGALTFGAFALAGKAIRVLTSAIARTGRVLVSATRTIGTWTINAAKRIGTSIAARFQAVHRVITGELMFFSRTAGSDEVLGQVDMITMRRLQLGAQIEIPPGTQGIRRMMSDLSVVLEKEVALVRLRSGRRVLVMGESNAVRIPATTSRVIAHTHHRGSLRLSVQDIRTLNIFDQQSTVLISPREDIAVRVVIPQTGGKLGMNVEPVEIIKFAKVVDGRTITCQIERCEDGSVGVSGDEIDTWIYEFTDDALKRATQRVAAEGYVRVQ